MDEVEAPWLFNEAQQALNRASVLHNEAFLRYREELTGHEAEVWDLTEKSDTYKLLSEKLQDDLVTARDEHAEQVYRMLHGSEDELEIMTNDPILQVQQRLEQIGELQKQVDTIRAEAEEFKKNMDILASKKEAAQTQLESTEIQLRAAREKASVQVKKIDELQSQLANLANELEAAKSEVAVANTKAHANNAKVEEARAQKLAFPEEDSDSLSESEGGEDPEGGDVASDEDQAT
ncbi:PREDICTED: uncharacterized protein LOC109206910 [Nicotiana attenuata]|uniref:uncharacterized protein LOC109206910 n=1 Tax=Nicotiana attenuata TaxID=49451 RepID=UPI0009057706|nr:PREDICTED: uncharacterized protein LOC109206910 [Nicotiana attenuata]